MVYMVLHHLKINKKKFKQFVGWSENWKVADGKRGKKRVETKLVFSIVWYATENGEEMRWSRVFSTRAQKKNLLKSQRK